MAKKRPTHEMFSIFLVLILFGIAATDPPDGNPQVDGPDDIRKELENNPLGPPKKPPPLPENDPNVPSPDNGPNLGNPFDWLHHWGDNGQKPPAVHPEAPQDNPPVQENSPKKPEGKSQAEEDIEAELYDLPSGRLPKDEPQDGRPRERFEPKPPPKDQQQQPAKNEEPPKNQPIKGNLPPLPIVPGGEPPRLPEPNPQHKEPLFPENFNTMKPGQCYESCYKNESIVEGKVGDGKEYCHQHCPIPVGDGNMKSWLEQIWFKKAATGDDGECGRKNSLNFIFCPPKGKGNQVCANANLEEIFICFQSKLDPENGLVDQILEVPNSINDLNNFCNAPTSREKISNMVDKKQLEKFEKDQKMHGFAVKFAGDGKFHVRISYSDKIFEYNVGGESCLGLEMFGSLLLDEQPFLSQTYAIRTTDGKTIAIQSQMNEMENKKENGQQRPNEGEKKMKKPKLEGLANGVALNSDCYKGPWLLGMDMMLQFEDGPLYIKTFIKGSEEDECYPQVSYMSSEIVPIEKCKTNVENDQTKVVDCEIGENVWEKSDKMPSERVKMDPQDGRTIVEFVAPPNNELLELTFAVPNPQKVNFNVEMLAMGEDGCQGKFYAFDFNLNNNDQLCQLRFIRQDTIINVVFPAYNRMENLSTEPVESGQNYDIEIDDKDLVKVKQNNEYIPIIPLPQNCSVQNERVQDFGRVIGSSNKFVMKFTLMPDPDSTSETQCDTSMFKLKFPKEYDLLVKKMKDGT